MKLKKMLTPELLINIVKLVISNPQTKTQQYQKAVLRPVKLKQGKAYQLEMFTKTQAFHENYRDDKILDRILALSAEFKQMDIFTVDETIQIKMKDPENIHVSHRKEKTARATADVSHNRQKQYLLKEGTLILPLIDQGIFTKDGKIVASKYDKYKQINRFVEMIDDALREVPADSLNIVDFGCGKSYLTFILYHYLTEVKKIPVTITGLDLKEDVIRDCNQIAKRYGYDGLHFEVGDIADFHSEKPVDMVITLHACDTATDLALYHAVNWGAKMIFSVPCCQHELNAKFDSPQFSLLGKYGIIKERISSLITDAIRGQILEICGYEVALLEFIDVMHSPKNILIRAIRKPGKTGNRKELLRQLKQVEEGFNASLTLHRLLADQWEKGEDE